jgi:hypothetical protein
MENWEKVFNTKLSHQAEIVKAILLDQEIHAVILNKRDSAYADSILNGNFEIYVHPDVASSARNIIENDIKFE